MKNRLKLLELEGWNSVTSVEVDFRLRNKIWGTRGTKPREHTLTF